MIVLYLRLISSLFEKPPSADSYLPGNLEPQKYDLDFVTDKLDSHGRGPTYWGKVLITVWKIHDPEQT